MGPVLFLLLAACAPDAPTQPSDCASPFLFGARKTDCLTEVAIEQFRGDPTAAETWMEANLSDPLQRDFVHLQVTMRVDPSGRWCRSIQDDVLRARCEERAKRPHLNRGLPPPPSPGGPPPGGAAPTPGGAPSAPSTGGTPSNAPPSTAPSPGAPPPSSP